MGNVANSKRKSEERAVESILKLASEEEIRRELEGEVRTLGSEDRHVR